MTAINWAQLLKAGLSELRLRPGDFWALTPAELMLMLGAGPGLAPISRKRLNSLAAAYPDELRKSS